MTLIEHGKAEAEQAERDRVAREEAQRVRALAWCEERTTWWFRWKFYDGLGHKIANPDYNAWSYGSPRTIENPDNPYPPIEGWRVIEAIDGNHDTSTFFCEGVEFVCRFKYERWGDDRADWDDGWWPDWYVVVKRGRVFKRRRVVRVYDRASVAGVLA